ncbi:ester cyclase [Umezawaea sp. NPDC059074]|uniref:ester cyclase n=1 Tax=Umezawaea sp. NPDC059074 TaxID=3346716 RepID=UPI0036CF5CE5
MPKLRSTITAATLGVLLTTVLTGAAQAHDTYSGQGLVARNTDLGRTFVAMENEHDAARRQKLAERVVSPAYVQHNAIAPPGRAGLLTTMQYLRTVMPDIRFTARDVFATNDRVVSRFTITGTVTGAPYLDTPPTGQKIEYDGMDVWTVRDGQLYEHWDQFDTTRALVQLGVPGLPPTLVNAASQPVNR